MWGNVLGSIHLWNAVFCLVVGAVMLLMRKGTRRHKLVGYAYVAGMLVVNLSALSLYRLNGSFNVFHVCALVSLTGIVGGMIPALLRRPAGWLRMHYEFMAWSYVGLVAAAVSESAVRLPSAPFWPAVGVGTLLVVSIGALCIHVLRPRYARMFEATEKATMRRMQSPAEAAQSSR